jgi:hypothetical protein
MIKHTISLIDILIILHEFIENKYNFFMGKVLEISILHYLHYIYLKNKNIYL